MMKRWGKIDEGNIQKKLSQISNAPVTYNSRLTILKSFSNWLVKKGVQSSQLYFKNTCQKSSAIFVHSFSFATLNLNSDATLIALSEVRGAIKTHLLQLQPPARVIAAFTFHSQNLLL